MVYDFGHVLIDELLANYFIKTIFLNNNKVGSSCSNSKQNIISEYGVELEI